MTDADMNTVRAISDRLDTLSTEVVIALADARGALKTLTARLAAADKKAEEAAQALDPAKSVDK